MEPAAAHAREAQEGECGAPVESAEECEAAAKALCGYEFNRKLLFKILVMANSQLAELVQR